MLEADDDAAGCRSRSRDRASSSSRRCAKDSRRRQTHWRRPQPIAPTPSDIKRRKLIRRDSSPSLQNVQCTPRRLLIHSPTSTARRTSEYKKHSGRVPNPGTKSHILFCVLVSTATCCHSTAANVANKYLFDKKKLLKINLVQSCCALVAFLTTIGKSPQ